MSNSPPPDTDFVVRYGGAKPTDNLPTIIHCVDDEIFGWLQRREQRKEKRAERKLHHDH
jgi:hypothetical protein